jgi:hypothetical protein
MQTRTEFFAAPDVSNLLLPAKHYACAPGADAPRAGVGFTLLFTHATGMHKECWEPTIEGILKDRNVRDAWSLEWPSHGEGAAANAAALAKRKEGVSASTVPCGLR